MPITKTSDGLILLEDFDEDAVSFYNKFGAAAYYLPHPLPGDIGYAQAFQDATGYTGKSARVFIQADQSALYGALIGTLNLGTGSGRRYHIMHKVYYSDGTGANSIFCPFGVVPAGTPWYSAGGTPVSPLAHDWQHLAGDISNSYTGTQTVTLAWGYNATSMSPQMNCCVDHLVICKNDLLTVTSLTSAQKVEAYYGGTLVGTATVAWGATQVQINIGSIVPPAPISLKIYQADGTLFETTPSYVMCGGDVWDWNPNNGTLSINASPFIIYRQASTGSPKTATITTTLLKPNGTPYAGKTITFTASLGSVGPTSAVTNTNGQATTTLSSSDYGIAIVRADWVGDATAPAARVFLTVHVFYDAEVPDATKPFQFFNQGVAFQFDSGEYANNGQGITEPFQVVIPAWDSRLTKDGLVSIYRKGVKEFGGILKMVKRTLGSRSVTLSGSDASILLSDRVLDVETFPAWYPQTIIPYLLAKYPTCITAGSLSAYANTVSLMFSTEDLRTAIQRLCLLVGWTLRINADLSLDFASTFGTGLKPVSFTEGTNLNTGEITDDYTAISNSIHMKGNGISSIRSDANSIASVGVHEVTAFQASISDQATLDTACAALLVQKEALAEQITIEVVDNYALGSFASEDTITVTSPSISLSGNYVVKRIHRDMTDANYAKLELSSRKLEDWEYDAEYQRMVKDASVLV